jgi:hypothetical protein
MEQKIAQYTAEFNQLFKELTGIDPKDAVKTVVTFLQMRTFLLSTGNLLTSPILIHGGNPCMMSTLVNFL